MKIFIAMVIVIVMANIIMHVSRSGDNSDDEDVGGDDGNVNGCDDDDEQGHQHHYTKSRPHGGLRAQAMKMTVRKRWRRRASDGRKSTR